MLSNAHIGGRQFPLFRELLAHKYETVEIGEGHLRFLEDGPLLLINWFLLFQYSQAIFPVSIKALALTLAQNIHTLIRFLTRILADCKSPSSRSYLGINMKQ